MPAFAQRYAVEGLGVGEAVYPDSWQYQRYNCVPSNQYQYTTWCRYEESSGVIAKNITILHLYNNIVTYINKDISPAFFKRYELDNEIDRLSRTFNTRPNIYRSPNRVGIPKGIIATWGDISLQQLSPSDLAVLAAGQNPRVGMMVDFLVNVRQSARAGFPVYSLAGGKGYVWNASFDRRGKGKLRFFAADPTQMTRVGSEITAPPPTALSSGFGAT